ncbi:MAG: TRAP transporter permease, partial [Nitrososphaerota archaeon]|nr:TRAP transporter permease [Nitrososphaerota archaeon]
MKDFTKHLISFFAIFIALYHIIAANPIRAISDDFTLRVIHVSLFLAFAFLTYPIVKRTSGKANIFTHLFTILFVILSLSIASYVVIEGEAFFLRSGRPSGNDIIFGVVLIILVLIATYKTIGLPLVVLAIIFLLYCFIGPYIPGWLGHRGVTLEDLIDRMFLTTWGIYGAPVTVMFTYITLFIIFGALLDKSGLGKFIIDISNAIVGHTSGGPAKIAVVASSGVGTISGSAVANVVTTGTFTIPMMKKLGYKPHFAGAVEAVASTGGQLMPPVMGAAAFVMAELTATPYITICYHAAIPAILYYLAVFLMVHFEAKKLGLKGMPKSELPKVSKTLSWGGHLIIPLAVLVYLLIQGYSPQRAVLITIILTIMVSWFRKDTRIGLKDLLKAFDAAIREATPVAMACACAGIIIGVMYVTGLGFKSTAIFLSLSGKNLLLLSVLTASICLILGMGIPTTAAYITTAALAVPAMVELGVHMIVAHLFVFYYAILSVITPPVALAAYAASGIAKESPMKIGFKAVHLGIAAYIVPFMFLYNSVLIGMVTDLGWLVWSLLTAVIGIFCLAAGSIGYLISKINILIRLILVIISLLLIFPEPLTDAVGLIAFIAILITSLIKR